MKLKRPKRTALNSSGFSDEEMAIFEGSRAMPFMRSMRAEINKLYDGDTYRPENFLKRSPGIYGVYALNNTTSKTGFLQETRFFPLFIRQHFVLKEKESTYVWKKYSNAWIRS